MTESSAQYSEPRPLGTRSSLHASPPHDNAFPSAVTTTETSSARSAKTIRCRHCRHVAAAELTICPRCGRELKSAPPLLVSWGGPVVVTVLALLVLIPVVGAIQPGQWLRTKVSSGLSMAANFGEQLEPEVVIVMTPIAEASAEATAEEAVVAQAEEAAEPVAATSDGEPQVVAVASVAAPLVVADLPTPTQTALPTPLPTEPPTAVAVTAVAVVETASPVAEVVLPTATPTLAPTDTPMPTPSPSPTDTVTPVPAVVASGAGVAAQTEQLPTASPTPRPESAWTALPTAESAGVAALLPTPTLATGIGGAVGAIAVAGVSPTEADPPTHTPTHTPTSLPTPQVHQVKPGDTLVTIAARYAVTVDALMAANGIAAQDVYGIQPGQELIIPTGNETPTPTPTVTPEPLRYTVQPGDTLVSIAAKYGISTRSLMAANGIAAQDVYVIQPGQELIIPGVAAASAAAVPATAEDADTAIRLDAPVLISPETGTPMSCSGQTTLVWDRVQFIRDDDKYVLHLGFVSGREENGDEIVTWVLAQPRPATQTSWDLDGSLCGLASQAFGRQWRWWVEVVTEVDGETVSVSPPSPTWGFGWN